MPQAPTDWAASQIMPMFACFAVGSSAVLLAAGDAMDRAGPRKCGIAAAGVTAAGSLATVAALEAHNLPALYAAYSVLNGGAAPGGDGSRRRRGYDADMPRPAVV